MAPLTGIKVLDITGAVAGPLVGQLLGDLGAEVTKIESPTGDGQRGRLVQGDDDPPANPRFDCINRNKRGLSIDLHHPEALPILEELIRQADVLVVNYRPGVPTRMGFGPERCHELNPRLVWASITGFGDTGPWAQRRGADIWAQALGGTVAVQGSPGGDPVLGGTAFVDHAAPVILAFGIVAALYERASTGRGTVVKTSLLETALYMQSASSFSDFINGGPLVVKGGRGYNSGFPMGAYPCSDGEVVTMMISNAQWDKFLEVLGLDELRGREDLDTQEKRVARRHDLYPLLDKAFRKKTRAEWSKAFHETGIIRADPALRYDEVAAHPQVHAIGGITPFPHPSLGAFLAFGGPVTVGEARSDVRRGPPLLGEHSHEVLTELGLDAARVDALFKAGVVFDPEHPAPPESARRQRDRFAENLAGPAEQRSS